MIVKTDEIIAIFHDTIIERDDSPPFNQYVGYREKNGGRWFVFDESSTFTETIFLLEDLGASENYRMASKVKKLIETKEAKQTK